MKAGWGILLLCLCLCTEPRLAAQTSEASQRLISAESLVGATVFSRSGDSQGSVEQVVLGPSGRLVHLVMKVGGVLGVGGREIAVPLPAISLRPSEEGGADTVWLAVNLTSEQLQAAPALEARDRLELTDAGWIGRNADYYGVADLEEQVPRVPQAVGAILTVSQLLGHEVVGRGDTTSIGELEDILFSLEPKPAEFVIVRYGGTLGLGAQYVALPYRDLAVVRVGQDGLRISIPYNAKTITEQQHVTPPSFPELKLGSVRERIERN